MKGKLTKLKDTRFNGNHPAGIDVGYQKEGPFNEYPKVGEQFWIGNMHTSKVKNVISSSGGITKFATENSEYQLTVTDQRFVPISDPSKRDDLD